MGLIVDKAINEFDGGLTIEHYFFVDGIVVAVYIKKWSRFPTMNGNRWGWAYYLLWERCGLKQILGSKGQIDGFLDVLPDFVLDYAGERNVNELYIADEIIRHLNSGIWKVK